MSPLVISTISWRTLEVLASNPGQNIFGSQVQLQFWFSQRLLLFTQGIFGYADDDYDISACVNLYDEKVLFSPGVQKSITWKRGQFCQEGSERASWEHSCKIISRVPPRIPLIKNG